eukprot:XP_001708260.1 Hypothetical protein GL50803_113394 [Giardia lamblia ATCC 50803]
MEEVICKAPDISAECRDTADNIISINKPRVSSSVLQYFEYGSGYYVYCGITGWP